MAAGSNWIPPSPAAPASPAGCRRSDRSAGLSDSPDFRRNDRMLKIRIATRNDAAAIILVRREAIFAKAASHYDRPTLNAWVAADGVDRILRIEQEISDPGFIVLVAEAEGEIIGFAMA